MTTTTSTTEAIAHGIHVLSINHQHVCQQLNKNKLMFLITNVQRLLRIILKITQITYIIKDIQTIILMMIKQVK